MKWLWCLAVLRLGAQCLPVEGEWILARQMAKANPEFAALPAELPLAYAPAAGVRRIFQPEEIRRLAAAHGLRSARGSAACFEWPLSPIEPPRILAAMKQSLLRADAQVVLLDLPREPVPPGDVVFPKQGMRPAGNHTYRWTGFVRYGQGRRFRIRTTVLLSVPGVRIIAREELRSGQPVRPDQVMVQAGEFPPEDLGELTGLPDLEGKVLRKTVAAGSVLRRGDFVDLPLVSAGQTVEVEVQNGALRLLASGQAEQSGRRGDVIAVRNPASGVRYRARVERAGGVAVVSGRAAGGERSQIP